VDAVERGSEAGQGTAGITRTATRLGAATMLSRVFGLARDTAFATLFGTAFVADAFNLAFLVPNFFRRVVGEGNINPAFIPVFTEIRERRGNDAAGRFLRRVTGALLAVLLLMLVLGFLLASPLVRLYAHDWQAHPDEFDFAVRLLRILFPYLVFAGMAALTAAALNACRHFLVPALAPILLNVCFLAAAALAATLADLQARAVVFAVGGLAGGLAAWVIQLPQLRWRDLPLGAEWAPRDPDLKRMGALMVPALLALGVTQLNLFVDTLLALRLESGSLTALRLGNRVTLLPLGVIGVAVSTASLPSLSLRAARAEREGLLETLSHTLRLLTTLLVPAACGLILLAKPIVALLFQYGEFTAERSTPMTAAALAYYALGLPAYGLVKGLAQAFYSVQDTKTPVRAACVAMVANVVLNIVLMKILGLRGLALATSLAAYLNVGLLFVLLPHRVGRLARAPLLSSLARTIVATAALAGACWLATVLARAALPGQEPTARAAVVLAGLFGGLGALILVYRILGHREMSEVLSSLPLPGRRRS
jgi:putative peptidoglycan lipid II flippase